MPHERFRYRSPEELRAACAALGLDIPLQADLSPLVRRVRVGGFETPNALAVHPMEGCDGQPDGSPGPLTERRYVRFARGGAGLLWFEATSVVPEARANPRQLWLHEVNASSFAAIRERALVAGQAVNGSDYHPLTTLQLTHSGRYSRPMAAPAPILAHHDGVLDRVTGATADQPLISDDELDALIERYVAAALLAQRCGFDAVDIKSCHRYLMSELLAAHTRPGRYGGSFENRARLLLAVVQRVREAAPGLLLMVRLNVYDGHPYPWGWGVSPQDPAVPDLTEPLRLIRLLREAGVCLINVTAGNPYFTPHINRPFDQNVIGGHVPDEHPLQGVARLVHLARDIKQGCPDLVVVGTGYSWLRQYLGMVAAGVIARGWADIVGVGREAFAYPDFARDLITRGTLDRHRACVACSRCTQIMRDHGESGCSMLDREVYGPIYQRGRETAAG
jgi:2,4-dienoyl-CoA reductase-like NADH-dependent reductase (Old Yellow Enzyme family)